MRIVGDVEFESAVSRASFITPVPGRDGLKVWLILILELIHLSVSYLRCGNISNELHFPLN